MPRIVAGSAGCHPYGVLGEPLRQHQPREQLGKQALRDCFLGECRVGGYPVPFRLLADDRLSYPDGAQLGPITRYVGRCQVLADRTPLGWRGSDEFGMRTPDLTA